MMKEGTTRTRLVSDHFISNFKPNSIIFPLIWVCDSNKGDNNEYGTHNKGEEPPNSVESDPLCLVVKEVI